MTALAQDILALVRIPSVTGQEKELADLIERRLREGPAASGNKLLRLGDSLLLHPARRRSGHPLVLLAGHIDTVPWADCPAPELRDGRIVGRGSADMKAGVAVMLSLAEQLPVHAGFADRAYILYTGEEGSLAINALPSILDRESWLCGADLGVMCEPTGGNLELGCNGSIHVRVSFEGHACHSARPWQGTHPLVHALPWMTKMLRYPIRAAEVEGVVFREVVSLTTVRAGEVRNVIPGRMDVNLNLRYPPDRTAEEAEALVLGLCNDAAEGVGRMTAEIVDHSPAGRIDASAPLYRHLLDSTGLPRRAKQGWTDVARLTARGIPALNWGPGDPELAHTRDEVVEVDQAEDCLERMKRFFLGPGVAGGHPGGGA